MYVYEVICDKFHFATIPEFSNIKRVFSKTAKYTFAVPECPFIAASVDR